MPREPEPPSDDLYARLGVAPTAGAGQIEAAWRELMKRHHPDVAGPLSTALARQLNVARDWLADPTRRRRYDAVRRSRGRAAQRPVGAPARPTTRRPRDATPRRGGTFDPWSADYGPRTPEVRAFLRVVERMSEPAVARLRAGPGAPLADTILGFVPEPRRAALERVEIALASILPADRRREPTVVTAIVGRAFAISLGDLLGDDELVSHLLSDAWATAQA